MFRGYAVLRVNWNSGQEVELEQCGRMPLWA